MNEKENVEKKFTQFDAQVYSLMKQIDGRLLDDERQKYRDNGVITDFCFFGISQTVNLSNSLIDEYLKFTIDPPENVSIGAWGPYSFDGNDGSSPNQHLTTLITLRSQEVEQEYLFRYSPEWDIKLDIQKNIRRVFGVREYDRSGVKIVPGSALIEDVENVSTISPEELYLLFKTIETIL